MGGYACLQNKRREGNGAGTGGREGRSRDKRETIQPEGGREYAHQQISKRRTQNVKHLATAMNLSAKAEQPENTPQEVLGETCVYRTNPNTASSETPNWKKGGAS